MEILQRPKPNKKDSSKFITNQDETLKNRISQIIHGPVNIVYLDFLVGYFRISGFIHLYEIIQSKLQDLKEIRILVGIKSDEFFNRFNRKQIDISTADEKEFIKAFCKEQAKFLNEEDYSKDPEEAYFKLLEVIKRIRIKIVRNKNVHAKFYIFSGEPTLRVSIDNKSSYDYVGSVILGSSNLSHNGLVKHYEFNAELRDSDDIENALYEFERLWEEGVELYEEDFENIRAQSYLQDTKLKDLYYKLLIEYFGEDRIAFDRSFEELFPKDYKPLKYQIYAIKDGIAKLKQYNGFFLSDVVGLGKTLIASMIVKVLEARMELGGDILIVCPPALKEIWEEHFRRVKINRNRDVITHGSLHKIQNSANYGLVIVDESHKFKSSGSDRYKELQRICKDHSSYLKKVILISATPQNNSPEDLANQIYLFQDKRSSLVSEVRHLDDFFSKITKKYNQLKKDLKSVAITPEKQKNLKKELRDISEKMRSEVVQYIMIRRTRADIERLFQADLKEQGIKFPKIKKPISLQYKLEENQRELSRETLKLLNLESSRFGEYQYARYLVYPNLTDEGKKIYRGGTRKDDDFYEQTAQRLKGLVQSLLFKRFESSIYAFLTTIDRQIGFLRILIAMLEEYREAVFPKKDRDIEKILDEIDKDEIEDVDFDGQMSDKKGEIQKRADELRKKSQEKLDDYLVLDKTHFKDSYLPMLKKDLKVLTELKGEWGRVLEQKDAKFEEFKRFLIAEISKQIKEKEKRDDEPKIILFTEAKTTAQYLLRELTNSDGSKYGYLKKEIIDEIKKEVSFDFCIGVLQVDASNRKHYEGEIRKNFDANSQEKENRFHILISTDTLSEGINMHRSNILVNYDAPWNPAKLMQRAGRVNRIGTKYEYIEIYHFTLSEIGEEILRLERTLFHKAQSFHYTLGEDSMVYSQDEDIGSEGIYQIFEQEEEVDPELSHLAKAIELYEKKPKEFQRIKNLSSKIRCATRGEDESFFYLKQEFQRDNDDILSIGNYFYQKQKECGIKKIDFCSMADRLLRDSEDHTIQSVSKRLSRDFHYYHAKAVLDFHKNLLHPSHNPPSEKTKEINKAKPMIELSPELSQEEKKKLLLALDQGRLEPKEIIQGKANLRQILEEIKDLDEAKQRGEIFYPDPVVELSYTAMEKIPLKEE